MAIAVCCGCVPDTESLPTETVAEIFRIHPQRHHWKHGLAVAELEVSGTRRARAVRRERAVVLDDPATADGFDNAV